MIRDQFWQSVDMAAGPDACWPWTRALSRGYGHLQVSQGHFGSAHRYAYELANGPIPAGMFVCHTCDNPPCCNPAHLFLGTAKDNSMDMMAKGRNGHGQPGVHHRRPLMVCMRGHALDDENLYVTPTGRRQCIACQRQRVRDWRARSATTK